MKTTPPSAFPVINCGSLELRDGTEIPVCRFCLEGIGNKRQCQEHYKGLLTKPEGYYQCPFGLTTRTFRFAAELWAITGIIAFPRFDTPDERRMAKEHAELRVARKTIEAALSFFSELERLRADLIQDGTKVLPQAFHELRKLNGAVLQHAEREMRENHESSGLLSIKSAAELMRNNFDILEALSNIEGMRALPSDSTINLYDLAYKVKKVYQERAAVREMSITVSGVRAIVRGSQKSFPIVPAVLIENAIKYGTPGSNIQAEVSVQEGAAYLRVRNETDLYVDPARCFDRGARYAPAVEGGGFGLYLAREIVSAHRGAIDCVPHNHFVEFAVRLPLEKVVI